MLSAVVGCDVIKNGEETAYSVSNQTYVQVDSLSGTVRLP